jgi:hypothetical protein
MRKAQPKVKKRSPLYVRSKQVHVRVPPAELDQITAWIDRQPDSKPTLPNAIRRLTAKALACEAAQGAT